MNFGKKFVRVLLFILGAIVAIVLAFLLVRWTRTISSRQRQNELRQALQDVISTEGERGLLEMAGVPVNNIFYGDTGLTLFQGDQASWNYSADELQNIYVYENCNAAVVHINTLIGTLDGFLDVIPEQGTGSGFLVSTDGTILTNAHVVEGATSTTVSLADGTQYDAVLVGVDSENDLALIKITVEESKELTALSFGDSSSLTIGQKVLALGNPFGYDRTMVTGIISGLSRPVRNEDGQVLLGMIQTDAPINPGNSGGPLLNSRGEVIGISTSIYTTTGTSQGLSFAVPSETAAETVEDLIKYGKVSRGWLDIVPVQLSQQIVEYAGLKVSKGILVSQTVPGGKAEKSGLKGGSEQVLYGTSVINLGGDVITSINGLSVSDYSDLYTALGNTRPGDKVNIIVNRKGTTVELKTELVERTTENVGWIVR